MKSKKKKIKPSCWTCKYRYNILMLDDNLCQLKDSVCPICEFCDSFDYRGY
jgi:hypothetical protein